MAAKIVVVWANCQGLSIAKALMAMHPEELDVHLFMNYEYIRQGLELPSFMRSADIFLYQNYRPQEVRQYDLDWISENILPAQCLKVSFPTLHSITLQFCHEFHEPNNSKTIGLALPHGAFFYGIKPLADYYLKLVRDIDARECRIERIQEAVGHALTDTFIQSSEIEYHLSRSSDFLREKSLNSDTPGIYAYIMDNYRNIRLWHNPYHPNALLLDELCRQIFAAAGLTYNPTPDFLDHIDDELRDWVMPILPSVQAALGLNVGSFCSSKYHPEVQTAEEYLSKYLLELYA
jgi:hypothetical protein